MKKKGLSHRVKKIFGIIGCLILAIFVWLVVKYSGSGNSLAGIVSLS